MQITKENRFIPYEETVKFYKKYKDPEDLRILLDLQKVYNKLDWCEVYEIDGDGLPHYRVKEEVA